MSEIHSKNSQGKPKQANKSKPLFVILGVFVVVMVVMFLAFQNKPAAYLPEVTGAPSLQTDNPELDLGNQKLGQQVEVVFQIKNVGDQTLVFDQAPYIEVKEGCCPSTPLIGKMSLKPGESTTLSFPMMMHAGMGGYHDFRVHLPNNDPTKQNFEFVVLSNWVE